MLRITLTLIAFLPLVMVAQEKSKEAGKTFTVRSTDLGGQATQRQVFNGFGCSGGNISPQLSWENAPEGTKSFAVTMYDPDAPTGSGWWHWVVYNLPASTTSIPTGAGSTDSEGIKGAIQAKTDFGATGYGGPCPPEGDGPHQYIITVHALGTERLDVPEDASPALIGFNLNANSLAKASLIFYYGR